MLAKLTVIGAGASSFVARVFAENPIDGDPYGTNDPNIHVVKTDFKDAVAKGINYFLSFLTLLIVVMIIYAGVLFVTAQGDEKQSEKAKKMIVWSAVGVIVIMLSYAITKVILGAGLAVG